MNQALSKYIPVFKPVVPPPQPQPIKVKMDPPTPLKTFEKELELMTNDKKVTQKSKKRQEFDINKFRVINLSYPTLIQNPKCKKKYKIQIKFMGEDKKQKIKTVLFGEKGINDYIDDGDEGKRMMRINLMKNITNIFSPKHWRIMLLNRKPTLKESYMLYMEQLGLI